MVLVSNAGGFVNYTVVMGARRDFWKRGEVQPLPFLAVSPFFFHPFPFFLLPFFSFHLALPAPRAAAPLNPAGLGQGASSPRPAESGAELRP